MLDLSKAKVKQQDSKKAPQRGTLLLVDDERENIDGIIGIIGEEFDILTADNAEEALDLMTKKKIQVIISDQKMPGMTGIELFMEAKKRHHNATRIILTGYADIENVMTGINDAEIYSYLTKPIVGADLRQKISEAFDYYEQHSNNRRLLSMIKKTVEENASLKNQLSSFETVSTESSEELKFLQKPTKLRLGILFLELYNMKSAQGVNEELTSLFSEFHRIINDSGGIVDKHLGDGLMAVFGLGDANASIAGISAINNLLTAFPLLVESNYPSLKETSLAIGFSGGEVVLGMLGTENRMEMAVIGETANKAARFRELAGYSFTADDASNSFGELVHGAAIMDSSLTVESKSLDIIKFEKEGDQFVRSFPDIKEVAIQRA